MMMMALKAAVLLPLALGAIAVIAGKALLVGKIALVISAIIGLKKLLSGQKHVTYEVVAHPHHSSSSSHSVSHDDGGHGGGYSAGGGGGDFGGGYSSGGGGSGHGWARSLPQDAQNLAYSAHRPQIQAWASSNSRSLYKNVRNKWPSLPPSGPFLLFMSNLRTILLTNFLSFSLFPLYLSPIVLSSISSSFSRSPFSGSRLLRFLPTDFRLYWLFIYSSIIIFFFFIFPAWLSSLFRRI